MKLRDKVDQLLTEAEALVRSGEVAHRNDAERQRRWEQVVTRWNNLAAQAASLMSEDDIRRVDDGTEQANANGGPFDSWLSDLEDGRCRLPELTAETMRDLLLAWLDSGVDKHLPGVVCVHCGLEYPHHLLQSLMGLELLPCRVWGEGPPPWHVIPDDFRRCPHCGQSNNYGGMDWPHLVAEKSYPWMDLDGYVGKPPQRIPQTNEK
jgi:hypothetical protein